MAPHIKHRTVVQDEAESKAMVTERARVAKGIDLRNDAAAAVYQLLTDKRSPAVTADACAF